ncbi:MAG: ANTAR domain-containing response regulator, partial [Planctomycetaceae bacterium]
RFRQGSGSGVPHHPAEEINMTDSLRIVVAEDEPELLADLTETLIEFGHEVVAAVEDGKALVDCCLKTSPDLVITDIKMPDMDGLEAATRIREQRAIPVVIVSAYHDEEFIERSLKEHVLAYLIKPLNDESLKSSIELAMQRFRELQALQEETADLQQALEDRKLIERAKRILMQRGELSEADAFRRLQDLSSRKNTKMVEIAKTIIEVGEELQN